MKSVSCGGCLKKPIDPIYAIPALSSSGSVENIGPGVDFDCAGVGGTMDLWTASATTLALHAVAAGPLATGIAVDYSIAGQSL
jgi:hypothetical protein